MHRQITHGSAFVDRGAGWAAGPVHVLPETESGHRRAAHAASYCYHGRPNPKLAPGQKAALFPRDGDVRRRRRTEKEGRRGRRAPGPHVVLVAPLARVFPSPPSLSLAGLIDLDVAVAVVGTTGRLPPRVTE